MKHGKSNKRQQNSKRHHVCAAFEKLYQSVNGVRFINQGNSMMKFFRALAVLFIAILITGLFLSAFPVVMFIITITIMIAFIVFVVKGIYEILKD